MALSQDKIKARSIKFDDRTDEFLITEIQLYMLQPSAELSHPFSQEQ